MPSAIAARNESSRRACRSISGVFDASSNQLDRPAGLLAAATALSFFAGLEAGRFAAEAGRFFFELAGFAFFIFARGFFFLAMEGLSWGW